MSDPFDLSDGASSSGLIKSKPAKSSHLTTLNAEQAEAVETVNGAVLVLAGAGTGKTRVLTTRLAHILDAGQARPGETLTVTFTNKAAREMKSRVEKILKHPLEGWFLGTFHSVAARILRRHAEVVGLKSDFLILDTDDQLRLLKQIIESHDLDEKRSPARSLGAIINRWKDRGLGPDQITTAEEMEFSGTMASYLYRDYQLRLSKLNAADFGDLLLHNLTIFRNSEKILEEYQQRFRYILVDEYQDTNISQYLWLRLLAQKHLNICCVGDDDQSIYAWRGAEVNNILNFEKDFPGAKVVRLEQNYRSTSHILGAASNLISHNENRLGKTLWTDVNGGEKIQVNGLWDGESEAQLLGDKISDQQLNGHSLNEIAILVRASHQTRPIEERFLRIGLPFRLVGIMRFYERLEIRDAIAYLRVIAQDSDDLAFERIINQPKRGIGSSTLEKLHTVARSSDYPLIQAARDLLDSDELRGRAKTGLQELMQLIDQWRNLDQRETELPILAQKVLENSGYLEMWKKDKSIQAPGRIENLNELINALHEFDTLSAFLEHISLVIDNAEKVEGDMVNIMTLHGAKGLEFDAVFLPGWEEGLFPHQRALDEGGLKALEEERRLAYVGLTRARRTIMISHVANRNVFGQWKSSLPSRFLRELPDENVVETSDILASSSVDQTDEELSDWNRPTLGRRPSNWGRFSRSSQRKSNFLETPPEPVPNAFSIGARIFHQKFGYGKILHVDGNKLEVAFDKAGTKKVMGNYVEPT
ncbi:MAG: UvrD-helicase domain-containing protein [Pseudomonadota bacterium]|nr:UvrD-helicase domain-containing protein [Pseudomonadota bacterium]